MTLTREVWEHLRRLVACMAKRGVVAMDIHEIGECLGSSEYVPKLMDIGALAYLDDGKCEYDKCKFAVLPKWGRRGDVIGALKTQNLHWLMTRYGGRGVFGDVVAWWIARAVFSYNLYDSVDLSYDLRRGESVARYRVHDGVWLISYVHKCGRKRCFRYELVTHNL